MIFGMTMVKVKPGQESSAYLAIQAIKGIKDIYRIFGEFSFFLIMDAYKQRDLDKIVDEIRMIGDIVEIRPILVTADSDSNLAGLGLSESEEHAFS
jgi:Lrp/AsnC ligand binding domain